MGVLLCASSSANGFSCLTFLPIVENIIEKIAYFYIIFQNNLCQCMNYDENLFLGSVIAYSLQDLLIIIKTYRIVKIQMKAKLIASK